MLVLLLSFVALILWAFYDRDAATPVTSVTEPVVAVVETPPLEPVDTDATEDEFSSSKIQSVIDTWVNSLGPDDQAGVVVMRSDGALLAAYEPNKDFFSASLYKIFVAYEGYRLVDSEQADPSEQYNDGRTRYECLDLMIRESDSPCAEAVLSEIGADVINDNIQTYGIQNTNVGGLRTTPLDTAKILQRISSGEGLSTVSQIAFLDSMKNQIFQDALNKGFTTSTVYNKVGFNEFDEYHDVAIIELTDGRRVIVSVLTVGVGTRKIASFGEELERVFAL